MKVAGIVGRERMNSWNYIIIEGFCGREISCKKDKYFHEIIDGNIDKTKKIKNPFYNPKYRTPKKPKYCEDRICQNCYFNDCPHLLRGPLPEKDYKKIMKAINGVM